MNKRVLYLLKNILIPVASVGMLLLIWYIAAKVKNNVLVLPYPKEVFARFFALWKEKYIYRHILVSLKRTAVCFVLSLIFALILGCAAKLFPPAETFLSPMVSLLRAAPTVAVILILYAFLATEKMAIVVGFLIGFPVLFTAVLSGLKSVDKEQIRMSKVYKVSLPRQIGSVYLPHILPGLFDAARSTLSLTLKVIVAAEILTLLPAGLGGQIQTAYASFEIEYLLAWTLIAIVLSYALEILVAAVKKLTVRWL